MHKLHTLSEVMPNLDTANEWWKTLLVTLILYAILVMWARPFRPETRNSIVTLVTILGAGVVAVLPIVGDLGFLIRDILDNMLDSLGVNIALTAIAVILGIGAWILHRRKRSWWTFILLAIALSMLVATDPGQAIMNGWAMFCITVYDFAYNGAVTLYGLRLNVTGI